MKDHLVEKAKERGQALVELALFIPVFLVLIGGVIEVSQLTISKNRVANAARAATRFGANGGEDEGMATVFINAVTQTITVDENRWDMWVVRATINGSGDAYAKWEMQHTYGLSQTVKSASFSENELKQQILEELRFDHEGRQLGTSNLSDLEIIGTYLIFDMESLLGLDGFPLLQGLHSVTSLNVMALQSATEQTEGCTGFPIAVHEGVRSVTPPGEGANPYPDSDDFDYPDSSPPGYNSFFSHVDNIPFTSAREGTVFRIQNGFGNGNFGWLQWNQGRPSSANTLEGSLTWPGDSADYTDHGDNNIFPAAAEYPHVVRGYVEPGDSTDTSLHVGDWVAANTGSINSNGVRAALEQNVNRSRTLRVIVWNGSEQQGNNGQYRISGFAIVRLVGYRLSQGGGPNGGGSWILAEFVRWDDSCGQEIIGP